MAKHKMPEELLAQMKKCWPAAVTPASEVTTHIYRLNDLFVTDARRHTARYGVSYTELQVLVSLRSAPGHELTPTELYSAILISSGGLTKVLHGLERRGLIARVADGADRRSRRVRLTPAGRALCERCVLALKASWEELFAKRLSPEDISRLAGLLRKLLFALEPGGEPEASAPTKSNRGSKRDRQERGL